MSIEPCAVHRVRTVEVDPDRCGIYLHRPQRVSLGQGCPCILTKTVGRLERSGRLGALQVLTQASGDQVDDVICPNSKLDFELTIRSLRVVSNHIARSQTIPDFCCSCFGPPNCKVWTARSLHVQMNVFDTSISLSSRRVSFFGVLEPELSRELYTDDISSEIKFEIYLVRLSRVLS